MNEPGTLHALELHHGPMHAGHWYYWTCICGAQSGPPFYASAAIASQAWTEHVEQ